MVFDRAEDIQELEDLLDAVANDQDLNDKAIDICKRLQDNFRSVRHGNIFISKRMLDEQLHDFDLLREKIEVRRRKGILDEYYHHAQTYGGPLDG